MRKEVFWAATIGISFGLIIAFGAWRINSSLNTKDPGINPTPRPQPTSEFKITLAKPENEDVVTEGFIVASGITRPLTWITISGEVGDYIIQSSDQGSFEQEIELEAGVNQIKITAFDPKGNQSFEKVIVVYSSSFQARTQSTPVPDTKSASEDSSIRQKVQEKVEAALNRPKAFIGTVTDIADSTVVIKTSKGEIRQISVTEDGVTVIKTGTVNKTVKTTDIAIGDFIVAMGYVNTNSVLSAQRILITSPLVEPNIDSTIGSTKDVAKSMTVASQRDGHEVTVTPDRQTSFYSYDSGRVNKSKFAEVEDGDQVILVTKAEDETVSARSVFIIKKGQN